jgi:hypothetical protein
MGPKMSPTSNLMSPTMGPKSEEPLYVVQSSGRLRPDL